MNDFNELLVGAVGGLLIAIYLLRGPHVIIDNGYSEPSGSGFGGQLVVGGIIIFVLILMLSST